MKNYIDTITKEVFGYESDGSQDHIIGSDLVLISDADLATLRAEQVIEQFDKLTYAEKRQAEYPTIADQLDEIYHNGIDSWKAVIKVTKDKFPMP